MDCFLKHYVGLGYVTECESKTQLKAKKVFEEDSSPKSGLNIMFVTSSRGSVGRSAKKKASEK